MKRAKQIAQRVQSATWGVLIIWVGVLMATSLDDDNDGLSMFVFGLIFLVSGFAQRAITKGEGMGFIIAGAALGVVGANDLFYDEGGVSVVAAAVIVIGAVVLARAVRPAKQKSTPSASDEEPT